MPSSTAIPDLGQAADLTASLGGIAAVVILALGTLAWRRLSTWIPQVVADVKMTKVQTTNSHDTNLRDDITATAEALNSVASSVEQIKTTMKEMKDGMERLDTRQADVHTDIRETRRDLRFATEYVRDVDKRLNEHMDESRKGGDTNG